VVTDIAGFTEGASSPLVTAMGPTLSFALDRRDAAVQDVRAIAPPPGADEARVTAHAAGAEVVNTFDTIMPQVSAMLDDELQQIDDLQTAGEDLPPSGKTLLKTAAAQISKTKQKINAHWPPAAEDED
jgi:hypothetical protein